MQCRPGEEFVHFAPTVPADEPRIGRLVGLFGEDDGLARLACYVASKVLIGNEEDDIRVNRFDDTRGVA